MFQNVCTVRLITKNRVPSYRKEKEIRINSARYEENGKAQEQVRKMAAYTGRLKGHKWIGKEREKKKPLDNPEIVNEKQKNLMSYLC